MRSRAAEAGFIDTPWGKYPRLQMRTVGELLEGKGIDYPHVTGANVTHKQAAKAKGVQAQAMRLFADADVQVLPVEGAVAYGQSSEDTEDGALVEEVSSEPQDGEAR
jgi:hypothetical protein